MPSGLARAVRTKEREKALKKGNTFKLRACVSLKWPKMVKVQLSHLRVGIPYEKTSKAGKFKTTFKPRKRIKAILGQFRNNARLQEEERT